MRLIEDFEIHSTLNPKLWNVTTKQLLPEVRQKIIDIVKHFEDYIEVPIEIVDVQIVGSNASYNYTNKSDIDVHIIANYEVITPETELLQTLYNEKKTSYNRKFDIEIRDLQVELYVQDIKTNVISNGIYSVCDNTWVKEPKPINNFKQHNISKELEKWKTYVQNILSMNDVEKIKNAIDTLYLIRHNSIACDGEFSAGNQLFKEIRNLGLLNKLKDKLDELTSKELSLESLTRGQMINRI